MVKKVIIGVLLIMLAMLAGLYLSLPYFVDKEGIKAQFVSAFKASTGLDLEISGDAKVESFPAPHVIINSMYVHNIPGGAESFLISIKVVKIWPAYSSFFGKRMSIGRISIDDADIELERLKTGHMNWQELLGQVSTSAQSASAAKARNLLAGVTISLTNGYVRYLDDMVGTASEYKDIDVVMVNGGAAAESTLKIDFAYRDRGVTVSGKIGNIEQALNVGEMPANFSVVSGKSHIKYEGTAGYKEGKFSITGNVKFSTDDVDSLMDTFLGSADDDSSPAAAALKAKSAAQYKLLPLEMKSDITSDKGVIVLPNLTLEGSIVKGGMRIEYTPFYEINLTANLNTLDLETIYESKFFAHKKTDEKKEKEEQEKEDERRKDAGLIIMPKTLFHLLNMSADITVSDAVFNEQHIKDTHILFDTTNGEMTIPQAIASLPGNTKMIFTGIGKEGFEGFTLEGEVDASGADFAEALKVLKGNGAAIPVQDFKRFRLKAQTIITSRAMRMSEIAARIENMGFLGGFIATFGERTKLQAAMRVGGLNLDHFTELWGLQEWRSSLFDTTPGNKFDSFLARWLRRLDYDSVVNLSMEQFTLNGFPREKAEFKLSTTEGKVVLDDIKTEYNGTHLNGTVILDVTNLLPKLDLKLTADTLDTAVFFTADGKPVPEPPLAPGQTPASRWSHQQLDFHWLDLISLNYHLKIGNFKQGMLTGQELDLKGGVDDRTFSVDSITGTVLGARMAGKFSIKGGKIPAITLAVNVSSLDPIQLVPFLPIVQGMTGKYNLSLRLDTSGIDMFSWISSLEGSVGMGGDHVNIQGFNLAGVIHAVSYVRTVADILNVVKRAFPGGDTMFSNIQGHWSVANGVFRITNARLTNDQADGYLTSQVDLINWQMQTVINLALKVLDPQHPPGMSITFNGNMDKPEIALDTRSLEEYVTNKTSQEMLHQYGDH